MLTKFNKGKYNMLCYAVRNQIIFDFLSQHCLTRGIWGKGCIYATCRRQLGEDVGKPCLKEDFACQPFHVSHGISSQQENTKDSMSSRGVLQSGGKRSPPMACSRTFSWASGLLPVSRPWEELGGIKVTASQAAGLVFTLPLFTCSCSLTLLLAGWTPADHLLCPVLSYHFSLPHPLQPSPVLPLCVPAQVPAWWLPASSPVSPIQPVTTTLLQPCPGFWTSCPIPTPLVTGPISMGAVPVCAGSQAGMCRMDVNGMLQSSGGNTHFL